MADTLRVNGYIKLLFLFLHVTEIVCNCSLQSAKNFSLGRLFESLQEWLDALLLCLGSSNSPKAVQLQC